MTKKPLIAVLFAMGVSACGSDLSPTEEAAETRRVVLAEFQGTADPSTGELTINSVTPRALTELPIGVAGPDVIRLSTSAASVGDTAAECDRANTFCADITATSLFDTEQVRGLLVEIDTISSPTNAAFGLIPTPAFAPAGVEDDIGLWVYGTLNPGQSAVRTWRFNKPTDDNFTFSGKVYGEVIVDAVAEGTETSCTNGVDDADGDADADCLDTDCAFAPSCTGGNEICGDNIDNDGDTITDCSDSDCSSNPLYCGGTDPVEAKLVFVTNDTINGAMGGLAGADAFCQAQANAAAATTGKTFRAFLSDGTAHARDRLNHSTTGYERVDGVKVADSWADLVDGTLDAAIIVTQYNAPLTPGMMGNVPVWTGSDSTGGLWAADNTCSNWSSSLPGEVGAAGDAAASDSMWAVAPVVPCEGDFFAGLPHLYCFEQ